MDEDLAWSFFTLGLSMLFTVGPLIFSAIVGSWYQKKKLMELREREKRFLIETGRDNIITMSDTVPPSNPNTCGLVMANVSVGPSWWQILLAKIKSLFGGSLTSYDRVLSFGRQEALQRLREVAKSQGWDDVVNVRLETAVIVSNSGRRDDNSGAFEFLAYGTGIKNP